MQTLPELTSLKELIEASYKKPTPDEFWAVEMLRCFNEAELLKKYATSNKNLLEYVSQKGWTPLHVAAIVGNRAGVKFLLGKMVSTTVKDDFGQTAINYIHCLHPELLV